VSPLLRPSPSSQTPERHYMTPSPVERWTATLSESWRYRKICTMSCRQSPVFIGTTSVGCYFMALQPESCAFFGTCVNDGRRDLSCSVCLCRALPCFFYTATERACQHALPLFHKAVWGEINVFSWSDHICVVPMADGSPACMPVTAGISERIDVGRAAVHMGLRYTVNLRGHAARHGAVEASF